MCVLSVFYASFCCRCFWSSLSLFKCILLCLMSVSFTIFFLRVFPNTPHTKHTHTHKHKHTHTHTHALRTPIFWRQVAPSGHRHRLPPSRCPPARVAVRGSPRADRRAVRARRRGRRPSRHFFESAARPEPPSVAKTAAWRRRGPRFCWRPERP